MKKSILPLKPKTKRKKNVDAALPAADQAIANTKRIVSGENLALHKEIVKRVGTIRDRVEKAGKELVGIANEVRAIGFLIVESWDKLPGKQMTLDFWHQQQELYVDSKGRQISLENLKWMVKVSHEVEQPLEIADLRRVFGMKQEMFALGGYHLEGQAPYLSPANGGADNNYYTLIKVKTEKFTREFQGLRESLVADPRFGPVERWDADRRAQVYAKLEPLQKELNEFCRQLNPVEV